MAKQKATRTEKKTEPPAPGRVQTDALHRALAAISAAKHQLPALTALERRAFTRAFNDDRCLRLGGRTRSLEVLKEFASDWLPKLFAGTHLATGVPGYTLERFSHACEVGEALGHSIEAQSLAHDAAGQGAQRLERAAAEAKARRTTLLAVLNQSVGDAQPLAQAELAGAAAGGAATPDALAASLGRLAGVGKGWLQPAPDGMSREEAEEWAFLKKQAGLTEGLVQSAQAAAETLSSALGNKSHRGPQGDSPEVNTLEGRLLLELELAMHAFNAANATNGKVPRLVPGSGTRAALSTKKAAKADPVEPQPVSAQPVTPAVAPAKP